MQVSDLLHIMNKKLFIIIYIYFFFPNGRVTLLFLKYFHWKHTNINGIISVYLAFLSMDFKFFNFVF